MNDTSLLPRSQHLLSLARTIRHYEEALTRANGERFNLFEILHVGHYEVRTHSPILAELLNPRGSHGQGEVFLQHFLDELKLDIQDFHAKSAQVMVEVSIGKYGRLDIEMTDENHRYIFIENKIYAGLRKLQLEDYHLYNPQAVLLFLTLYDEEPAAEIKNAIGEKLRPISYKTHIVRWLKSCRKEAATVPIVREAITQYLHLIERLTQQNTNARMNQEIINAVTLDTTGETYLAYASLRDENWNIRKEIIGKLNKQLQAIGQELDLKVEEEFSGIGEPDEGFLFTTPRLKEQNLKFGFRCTAPHYHDFCFGFNYIGPELKSSLTSKIQQLFKEKFEATPPNDYWPASAWGDDQHRNWSDPIFADIISGTLAQYLKGFIRSLSEIATAALKE